MTTVTPGAPVATAIPSNDALSANDALLDAGAVLGVGSQVEAPDTADALIARTYTHPVLPGRSVIRLVPGALVPAEDLSLDFLGFDRPTGAAEVGVVRQQALGFPAWALVHDPANGHHALALVKEIERLARLATSRIGPAKDGFVALGRQLAASVPHFLPTFYEEAGRAFIAADSATYGATMFGKAREAEDAYALGIDEERQHAVFLEFALAGALTAKALTGYARALAKRAEPAVAYERFRRLCVERTLGGLAPYAAMATDLRRLAKAAKLDQDTADEQVVRELLAAPTLAQAPAQFWTAYRPALLRLARLDPAVRGRLLGLLPTHIDHDDWLALLIESGAAVALTAQAGTVPAAAESSDGPAGWFGRFAKHRTPRYWRQTHARSTAFAALLDQAAERLRADGVPIPLALSWRCDLDILDQALALGLPVADPEDNLTLRLEAWLTDDRPGRRGLIAVEADPRFRRALATAVEGALPDEPDRQQLAVMLGAGGVRTILVRLLDEIADAINGLGLPVLETQIARARKLAAPEALAINPPAVARMTGYDLAPVLARTLRSGLLDEYGWAALEDQLRAWEIPAPTPSLTVEFGQRMQWPDLIVRQGLRTAVIGAEGVRLEHHLRIPTDQRGYLWLLSLRYVDGQLLVCWDTGPDRSGYWSGTPDDVFVKAPLDVFLPDDTSLALPGGGRTAGGRPLLVGDRSQANPLPVLTDGSAYWTLADNDWVEYDPTTGEHGRVSLPAFLAAGAVDGEPLAPWLCRLRPAPDGAEQGPLGSVDGLVGWRVRHTAAGLLGEGIDGRAFRAADLEYNDQLVGAVRFPGSDEVYGAVQRSAYRDNGIALRAADGFALGQIEEGAQRSSFAAGTALVPPFEAWHHLRPRDVEGSRTLRALTAAQAASLLAGEAVEAVLPGVTHPELRAGIVGVVALARKRTEQLTGLAETLVEQEAAPIEAPVEEFGPDDQAMVSATDGLIPQCYHRGRTAYPTLVEAATVLVTGEPPARDRTGIDPDWFDVFRVLPSVMYRAASPLTRADDRAVLLTLLDGLAATGLLTRGARLRQVTLEGTGGPGPEPNTLVDVDGRRLWTYRRTQHQTARGRGWTVGGLEYAPDGKFGPIPGCRITGTIDLLHGTLEGPVLARFVAHVREHGPIDWVPERVEALSTRIGVSRAEAFVLLGGFPSALAMDAEATGAALEALGLSKRSGTVAHGSWGAIGRAERVWLMGGLLPEDPLGLWTDGPALDPIARWADARGVRAPVDDELILTVQQAGVAGDLGASRLLHGLLTPATCDWLNGPAGDDLFRTMHAVARSLPWLAYQLPGDHPLRATLPDALDRFRARLTDGTAEVEIGYFAADQIAVLAADLGVTPVTDDTTIDVGPLRFPVGEYPRARVRPHLLAGPDDPALLAFEARSDWPAAVVVFRIVLGDALRRLVTGGGAAGTPQDPGASAPDLVAEVASTLGLGPDAATLYLQLLALPDPTDRNVARWTGWKPARLKKARTELAATDLVTEAKRPRAGRSLFLPCGWLPLGAPNLPVESWKAPMLSLENGAPQLNLVVPLMPVADLFRLAWSRVRAGDGPRFDELRTGRRR